MLCPCALHVKLLLCMPLYNDYNDIVGEEYHEYITCTIIAMVLFVVT